MCAQLNSSAAERFDNGPYTSGIDTWNLATCLFVIRRTRPWCVTRDQPFRLLFCFCRLHEKTRAETYCCFDFVLPATMVRILFPSPRKTSPVLRHPAGSLPTVAREGHSTKAERPPLRFDPTASSCTISSIPPSAKSRPLHHPRLVFYRKPNQSDHCTHQYLE